MSRAGMYAKMFGVYAFPSPPLPISYSYPLSSSSILSPACTPSNSKPHSGLVFCLGGPALMYWVTPSEGELFQRFSPELQKRNLEMREQRQADYEDFVTKLKEYSKSDKPIWEAAAEAQRKEREEIVRRGREGGEARERERREMREELGGGRIR